ncbi:MAG: hypothetical protein HamCj_09720 [Candidatus Hamiltonella defensa (Ceratovacuna japonica)]
MQTAMLLLETGKCLTHPTQLTIEITGGLCAQMTVAGYRLGQLLLAGLQATGRFTQAIEATP